VYEEDEVWLPIPDSDKPLGIMATNSVSAFIAQCKLSELCGDIMASFYAVEAKRKSESALIATRDSVRSRLSNWYNELPDKLIFQPWIDREKVVPIHIIVLQWV
jgi:hypothetical protein